MSDKIYFFDNANDAKHLIGKNVVVGNGYNDFNIFPKTGILKEIYSQDIEPFIVEINNGLHVNYIFIKEYIAPIKKRIMLTVDDFKNNNYLKYIGKKCRLSNDLMFIEESKGDLNKIQLSESLCVFISKYAIREKRIFSPSSYFGLFKYAVVEEIE